MPDSWPGARSTSKRGSNSSSSAPSPSEALYTPVASSCTGRSRAAAARPLRRSFSALRTTHSRKRYRTARKPNLRPTETGSSIRLVLQFEPDYGRAELDLVTRPHDFGPLDPPAIQDAAVRRAEIVEDP